MDTKELLEDAIGELDECIDYASDILDDLKTAETVETLFDLEANLDSAEEGLKSLLKNVQRIRIAIELKKRNLG